MIAKLIEKIQKTQAPVVVGLDPMLSYVPQPILDKAVAEYGESLEAASEAIWQFNKTIVDTVYDLIPAVKP
ncbi:MAG: orotidine 5'-phosphate decarboxylase, partial [Eubacterium sp.]|nr:orotidine 5'-phosphate decarboxylase [Eubacterium sp.]